MKTTQTSFLFELLLVAIICGQASAAPTLTLQPEDQSASLGATVRFMVTATSTAQPVKYQWRFKQAALDPVAVPSATTRQLFVKNVTLASAGPYDVVVSDLNGSVTSQSANLTVDPTFTKIVNDPLAQRAYYAEACAWGDLDGDGKIDLFITQASGNGPPNYMYRNRGEGSFVSVTNGATSAGLGSSIGAAWADFDNNGTLDLAVSECCGEADKVFSNNGDGGFTRLLSPRFRAESLNSKGVAWADYDCDGFVDLFILNPQNDASRSIASLYHNDGDGTLTRITNSVLVDEPLAAAGCSWSDYDGDGYPDLFVGTWMPTRGRLFRNNGDGTFSTITDGPIVTGGSTTWGCSWGDYDNDGHPDLFVARWQHTCNSLFRNNGDGTFAEILGIGPVVDTPASSSFMGAWGDYDNDGYLDLFVSNDGMDASGEMNLLFRNDRQGGFTQILTGSPANELAKSTGCAWGDYDDDGFLDLVVVNAAPPCLYRNNGNSNNWLKFKLIGTASNRAAIGAKVRVRATIWGRSFWQLREISGGGSPGQDDPRAHFGLGDAAQADTVRIEWPSGIVQELTNVAARQLLTITEHQSGMTSPPGLAALRSSIGALQLTLTGQTNRLYVIEASTNLVQWVKIAVRTNLTGSVEFSDNSATRFPQRFYRVVAP